jgi:hypothetical protein
VLSPFIISESERLLRSKPYIYSAEIRVMEEKNNPDSVKILVRARDIWSIRPDGSFDLSNNRGFLRLEDINFLGYGMSFFGAAKRNYTFGRKWSIDGGIQLDNVLREHITVNVLRESDDMGRAYRVALGRDFISPIFTWAGGIDFSWLDNHILEIDEDTFNILNEKLHRQEYWLGYATDFSRFRRMDQMQNEFYFAARFSREMFYERPIVHEYYGNHNLALLSFGYAFRRYHKTRYVRYLGRVEDIPAGTIVTFTSGKRYATGQSKTYTGLKAGYSFYQKRFGYLSAIMDGGLYFTQGKSELGALNANIMYFTPLLRTGNTSTRHFITLRGGYLHNPFLFEHLINLKRNEDIRGFPTTQTGNRRLTINYEINIYPPIRFLGFNFAAIGFVDLSWLPSKQDSPWKSSFYQGIGGGFRIRNELLVFRSIQVLFGFYPNGADRRMRFFEQPWRFYDMEFIEFNKPGVVIE